MRPLPRIAIYSSGKAFDDFFSRAIALEYSHVDIFSFRPGFVSTPLTKFKKVEGLTIDTKTCIDGCWKVMGKVNYSNGALHHFVAGLIVDVLPMLVIKAVFYSKQPEKKPKED
jgi:17beta-estradiol 17-dehydrogenase / very-long-chain 3-oxoacyl-CoA reductase